MKKISFFMSLLKILVISSLPTRSQLSENDYCFSFAFKNTLSKCQFGDPIHANKFIHNTVSIVSFDSCLTSSGSC